MKSSWKTTLTGLVGAVWVGVYPLISSGQISWPAVVSAALIAVAGFVVKDFDVTGGTNPATAEAANRTISTPKQAGFLKLMIQGYKAAKNIQAQSAIAAAKPVVTEPENKG